MARAVAARQRRGPPLSQAAQDQPIRAFDRTTDAESAKADTAASGQARTSSRKSGSGTTRAAAGAAPPSRHAAATDALCAVLLVFRNLLRQGQPTTKGEMRDGYEQHLTAVLGTEVEFAHHPAFVAQIVDRGDLASR